eukprot:m.197158 g.197158  ORF g.197158 m.197158 type:complete len:85 (+) comp15708_c0_seq8:2243-2497(+)
MMQVWYHANCNGKSKGCTNTKLVEKGGCAIWYDEPKLLTEVEEHLQESIAHSGPDIEVPIGEYDGKVVYGEKKETKGLACSFYV